MNIFISLLAFSSIVVANSQINTRYCGEDLEWDPVERTCRSCQYGTVYNKYTRKCLKISGKGEDCQSGFEFDFVETRCVDIDECNQNKYPCQTSEICVNEPGGYKCKPRHFCGQGYQFNVVNSGCEDVNECEKRMDNCGSNMVCENVPGSFMCRPHCPSDKKYYWNGGCNSCEEGFKLNRRTAECEDIDECEGPFKLTCLPYQERCVKIPGMSKCVTHCNGGTTMVDGRCHDIDECSTKTHNCSSKKKCENLFGTFQCVTPICEKNEMFSADLNSCTCITGFKIDQHTGECKDDDECKIMPRRCGVQGRCVNTPGSFNCVCNEGYHLVNGTCEDINECVAANGICGSLVCVNVPGGHKCVCPAGFRTNEYDICEDINECHESPNICHSDTLLFGNDYHCFNVIGSFKCLKSKCPAEYATTIGADNIRCDLVHSNCSLESHKGCMQTLPERIVFQVLQIPRIVTVPHKVTNIELNLPNFDSYNVQIIVRKAVDLQTSGELELSNGFMMTYDDDDTHAALYLTAPLIRSTEIICDVLLKSNYESQQRIHFLNQYHIFANN